MKYKNAKKLEGEILTLLQLDNHLAPHDNLSLFGCGDGREAIEKLIETGKSNFSYKHHYNNNNLGYCVEFELADEKPSSNDYSNSCDTKVKITSVWKH